MSQPDIDDGELDNTLHAVPPNRGLASVFGEVLFLVTVLTLLYPCVKMTFERLGRPSLTQLVFVMQVLLTFAIVALLLLVLVAQQMRMTYCAFIRPFVGITAEDKMYTSTLFRILVFVFLGLNYACACVGQKLLHFVVEQVQNRNNSNINSRTRSIVRPSSPTRSIGGPSRSASLALSECFVSPVRLQQNQHQQQQQQHSRCVFRDAETSTQWLGVNTNVCAWTSSHQEQDEEESRHHRSNLLPVSSHATQTTETVERRRSFLAFQDDENYPGYAIREEKVTRVVSAADLGEEETSFLDLRVDRSREVVTEDGEKQREKVSWMFQMVQDKATSISNSEASRRSQFQRSPMSWVFATWHWIPWAPVPSADAICFPEDPPSIFTEDDQKRQDIRLAKTCQPGYAFLTIIL
ncbi:uncharacterized protein LOC112571755 [Pomacea canaliculata]|uniref:uncharacterized protein LOC112571755 n=1 Tax=Pomacea canaliculata TaxID=400727 RepID=UPI000D736916|nr:uncharacterized protein LOC112571755 [Pomacea canaliculata]